MRHKNKKTIKFYSISYMPGLHIVKGDGVTNSFPRHLHKSYCVGILTAGKAQYINGNTMYNLAAGDIFLINPSQPHTILPCNGEKFSHTVLCFSNENNTIKFTMPIIRDHKKGSSLLKLIDNIINCDSELGREELLMIFLDEIMPYCDMVNESPEVINDMSAVCDYIESNCKNKLSLSELAGLTFQSKFYFIRQFYKKVGLTPYEYLIQARIKQAQALLKNGMPELDVSIELGFNDESHFINSFKKNTGVTPLEYAGNYSVLK